MENIKDLMSEYARLAGKEDDASQSRMREILAYVEQNATEDEKKYVGDFISKRVARLKVEVECLRAKIGEADYKLLPISYIAKEYFGKSAAWLLQRLNGYEVRGQVYTLSEQQKDTFNRALQEISQRLAGIKLD